MKLNPNNIPSALVSLLPMAERWGIGDDFERENHISKASISELDELVHCIDEISDDDLFGWLAGEESFSQIPSDEYLAITNMTMAIESAKLKLKK
jgi:succinate dehydrogenase flavin-adding protein (antitoxin of CptAB toxin-antitoxin module)